VHPRHDRRYTGDRGVTAARSMLVNPAIEMEAVCSTVNTGTGMATLIAGYQRVAPIGTRDALTPTDAQGGNK